MQARQLPSAAFRQTHHCIDDVAVELVFGSKPLEQRERASLARWLSDELLPALDELFSFYAPGEQIIRFEQLVFDFGHLPASDYRQIIREQLVQKLTHLIKAQSLPLQTEQRENLMVNRVTETGAALTLLLDYLRTGQLTAQQLHTHSHSVSAKSSSLHQQLLESLLAEQHIAARLRALPNRRELIARLVKQFSERHRTELLRQLAPQQVEMALALLDIWQTSAARTSTTEVQTLWQFILQIALAQPELAQQQWLQSLMQDWRKLEPLQARAFIQTVQQASWAETSFASSSAPASWLQLQTQLNVLLQEHPNLNADNSPVVEYGEQPAVQVNVDAQSGSTVLLESQPVAQPFAAQSSAQSVPTAELPMQSLMQSSVQSAPAQSEQEQAESAQLSSVESLRQQSLKTRSLTLQQQLAQTLIRGDIALLENNWRQWQTQHKPLLIAGLKHYLVSAELRQQLLLKLPLDMHNELLLLLAPDLAPLLHSVARHAHNYLAVIEQLESAHIADEMPAQRQAMTASEWLRRMYEIMANLIFTGSVNDSAEPIAVASLEKFFSELVFHVAIQRDIPARELHRQWQQVLQGDGYEPASEFTQPDTTEFVAQASAAEHSVSDSLASDNLDPDNPLADSIVGDLLLSELQPPESLAPASENKNALNKDALKKDASTIELLLKKIHGVFVQGSAQELETLWPQIIAASGTEIVTAVRRYWAIASIRQQMLPRLTLTSIQQLLVLIAPAYQSWLAKMVKASAHLHQEAISLQTGAISVQNEPISSAQEFGHQADAAGAIGAIAAGGKAQATTTEAWLREAYAIISAILFGSSSASPDTIFATTISAAKGSTSNGLAANPSQPDQSSPSIAPAELLQQFTRHYAQAYQLPVAALGFLWRNLLDSGAASAQAGPSVAPFEKGVEKSSATDPVTTAIALATTPPPDVSESDLLSAVDLPVAKKLQVNAASNTSPIITSAPANSIPVDLLLKQSAQELFEWCMQLKHSPQRRAQLPAHEALMARLIDSFVKQSPNFSPEFRQYFLVAVDEQTSAQINRATFFRQVLLGLIDDELIDLDAIAAVNRTTAARDNIADASAAADAAPQLNQASVNNETQPYSQAESIDHNQQAVQSSLAELPMQDAGPDSAQQTRQRLAQLVQELRAGRIDPFGLHMSLYYWQRLVEQSLQAKGGDTSHHAELREAIRRNAGDAIDPNYFYQQVIHALLADLPLDMEAFIRRTAVDQDVNQVNTIDNTERDLIARESNSASGIITPLPETSVQASTETAAQSSFEQPAQLDKLKVDQPTANQANANPANEQDIIFPEQSDSYYSSNADTEASGHGEMLRTPELTLEQLLRESTALNTQQMQQHVNLLLQHFSQAQAQEWLRVLREPVCAQRLIQQVPGHLLHQIVQRLQPAPFAALDPIVKLASEALALLVPTADPLLLKQARWEFVFARLFGPANPLDAAQLLQTCCEQLAATIGFADSQRLLQLAERRLALLKPVAAARPSMSLNDGNTSEEPVLNFEAGVHLNNVGMVLASPFLPRLFSMFNLLEDGKFIHPGAADRAAHLLQYMVTGQSETPEYELTLNKILCGISTSMPISAGIDVTEQEQQVIEQMLQSMIQHWKALGSTSVAGLRETFMQRQGWLILDEDYWRLKVQERTFDMLLDRLPWNISMIKHAWMDRPLRVSWREQS